MIVLSEIPSRSSTITAASSESGIAVREMSAVRRFPRKSSSTPATSTAPSSSEWPMLRSELSMKVAGRCRRG